MLSRATTILAGLFMVTSLGLSLMKPGRSGVLDQVPAAIATPSPAASAAPAPASTPAAPAAPAEAPASTPAPAPTSK